MEIGTNNNLDHKKVFIAVTALVVIAILASLVYYFIIGKNDASKSKEESVMVKQLTEEEKAEIEKNLVSDTTADSLSKKEKAAIEKNFINSGNPLAEEEKRQIEKISAFKPE